MAIKILVGVNTLTSVSAQAYSSHCQEWFRMGRDLGKDYDFIMYNPHRAGIDNMRNSAVRIALETGCDYIYFLDDDMVLSPGTLKSLLAADKDIVMAHTVIRAYPYLTMAFVDMRDKRFSDPTVDQSLFLSNFDDMFDFVQDDGLVRVDAIGCACVLIKAELFKKVPEPWFVTLVDKKMTEDVYFCLKYQRAVGRHNTSVYVDTKVPTGHQLEPEFATPKNVEALRTHFENRYPTIVQENKVKDIDRGDKYKSMVEEAELVP